MTDWTVNTRLRFGAYWVIAFGGLMSLSLFPPVSGVLNFAVDMVFWPLDGLQITDSSASKLLTAVIGGITSGWGVTVLLLSGDIADRAPESVRRVALSGYLTWFTVDGVGSVIAGAPWNLLGNTLFLCLLVVPLLKAYPRDAVA
ncbi:hypothetical protein SAMN04488030_1346 [Aliiroseovarius halocynthiae]|uniref:Uncharacterized protein n=1 Tax=Aliiroseovarius halocynthiae TaxID=985055 RepID=A0A545SWA1_9RHOB|nr:hypothetical protein [Aliiroseovarius halocynthiae]TQV69234.1 hypothetical protein FIL88_06660 [Aliiroseovarius halocynthiae]SMR72001.1 hypothetical protein SAMN04488030_1346 [Aliiroseovarius halocynthiae]